MNPTYPTNQQKLLSLQETAQKLGVTVDILLTWNEYNILKPTITPSGTVGYTQEQINQFLRIQQTLASASQKMQNISQPLPSSLSPAPSYQDFNDLLETPPSIHQTSIHTKKLPLLLFPTLTIITVLILIGVFTQHDRFQSLLASYEHSYETKSSSSGSQTSNLPLDGHLALAPHTQQKTDDGLSKNLHDNSDSLFAQQPTNAPTTSKSPTPTPTSRQQSKALIATVAGVMKTLLDKKTASTSNSVPTANDVLTYASLATNKTNTSVPNSPFDKSGNLTGNMTKNDTLAMNISGVDITSANRTDQISSNLRNQLILVIMGTLAFIVFLIRKPQPELTVASTQPVIRSERLFELDQKMDGTVVLYFDKKAYKISKPELHSDSDQFIERLMTLYQPGSKDMEYDASLDSLKLTAPLSRLVTRLGFVGVKRDLFFPRTAKHSVLFRKYITQDDLKSLNVTPEQILSDMTVVS